MLEDIIIVGIVMAVVELLKSCGLNKQHLPLVVLGLAGLLNVANAAVFDSTLFWRPALLEGLELGAIAGGIYGLGKATLGRS